MPRPVEKGTDGTEVRKARHIVVVTKVDTDFGRAGSVEFEQQTAIVEIVVAKDDVIGRLHRAFDPKSHRITVGCVDGQSCPQVIRGMSQIQILRRAIEGEAIAGVQNGIAAGAVRGGVEQEKGIVQRQVRRAHAIRRVERPISHQPVCQRGLGERWGNTEAEHECRRE